MKKIATIAAFALGIAVLADIEGDYNTWLGYLAGDSASGNRTTVQGAGAGGGAEDLYRTDLIGAAAGVYGVRFFDTVGIGYRALRYSTDVSNTVAIGSHALENVGGMGGITDATWINGHFVANPPVYDAGNSAWRQTPGEFYITGDASLTNSLAPIWYDGTNLHLRGYSPGGSSTPSAPPDIKQMMAAAGMDYLDKTGIVWTCRLKVKKWEQNSQLDPTTEDVISYFTETNFAGMRAWAEIGGNGIFLFSAGDVYYAGDMSQLNVSDPLYGLSSVLTIDEGALVPGVSFNLWSPNVTSFEYDGWLPKGAIQYVNGQ